MPKRLRIFSVPYSVLFRERHKTQNSKMHEVANRIIDLLSNFDPKYVMKMKFHCRLFRAVQLHSGQGGTAMCHSRITSQIDTWCAGKAKYRDTLTHASHPRVKRHRSKHLTYCSVYSLTQCLWGRRIYSAVGQIALYVSYISLSEVHYPHWAPRVAQWEIIVTPAEREEPNLQEAHSVHHKALVQGASSFRGKVVVLGWFLWCFSHILSIFGGCYSYSSLVPQQISISVFTGSQYAEMKAWALYKNLNLFRLLLWHMLPLIFISVVNSGAVLTFCLY